MSWRCRARVRAWPRLCGVRARASLRLRAPVRRALGAGGDLERGYHSLRHNASRTPITGDSAAEETVARFRAATRTGKQRTHTEGSDFRFSFYRGPPNSLLVKSSLGVVVILVWGRWV